MAKVSRVDINKGLNLGNYRIRSVSAGKSDVWKTFGIVVDSGDKELDFVVCKLCNAVLYSSIKVL